MVTQDDGKVVESQFPSNGSPMGPNETKSVQATTDSEGRSPDHIYYVATDKNQDSIGMAVGQREQGKSTWLVLSVTSDSTNCSVAAVHVLTAINSSLSASLSYIIPSPWALNNVLDTMSTQQATGKENTHVYKVR